MNVIETKVPIGIDDLKKFFLDKTIKFLINYDESDLQGEKFLTYLSNLDLPCDVVFDKNNDNHMSLLLTYIKSKNLVSIPSLEKECLNVFLQMKQIYNFGYDKFISDNTEELNLTLRLIESLRLYNFHCINSKKFKDYVEQHEHKSCDDLGVNFVNIIKYDDFNLILENVKNHSLYFYDEFFKEYVFKGKNLYYYWATENNPLFLLTWAISTGYNTDSLNNLEQENASVSPI